MRITGLPIVAIVAGLAYATPLAAQSLADVAKKEEERRKEIKAPSKVLTNKDLGDAPAPTSSTPSASSAPSDTPAPDASRTPKDADKPSGGGAADKDGATVKDQKYWSAKMKSLQDALSRDQVHADAMQTQVNSLTTDFVNRDDPAQRAQIEQRRQGAVAELARLKEQIKKDQKSIDDLQEEARRAGVPPGWLR